MNLDKFHELYNFRRRSKEELQALHQQIRDRSSSSSSYNSSSSSSRSSSSSSSRSRRSRSRSLPYSREAEYLSEDSDENRDAVDALLEEPFKKKSGERRARKRRRCSSSSESDDEEHFGAIFREENSVLLTNLYRNATIQDIKSFVSSTGKVVNLQLDFSHLTHEFKNAAILEFENRESVILALGLNGRRLKGVPIVVQSVRKGQLQVFNQSKCLTLKVENLPSSFNRDKLKTLFRSFGQIKTIHIDAKFVKITYFKINHALAAARETNQTSFESTILSVSVYQ